MLEQAGHVVNDSTLGNSTIFPGDERVAQHDFKDIAPGAYRLEITFDYGGDTLIQGTTDFTVK
jgi:hypothetical protein